MPQIVNTISLLDMYTFEPVNMTNLQAFKVNLFHKNQVK